MRRFALAVALVLLVPTGVVAGAELEGKGQAVEQHTSYVRMVLDDGSSAPGYAAVAGLVACRPAGTIAAAVLWFNDQVLFRGGRRAPDSACASRDGNTHVWATEESAPDPRGNPTLAPTGTAFAFRDPNGIDWEVVEYVYHQVFATATADAGLDALPLDVTLQHHQDVRLVPWYAWVVRIGPSVLDPTLVDYYNFVTIVDFDRVHGPMRGHVVHSGERGDVRAGNSHNASSPTASTREPHVHDTVQVHLWTGPAPERTLSRTDAPHAAVHTRVLTALDVV